MQYSKEEYLERVKAYKLPTHAGLESAKKRFWEIAENAIHKFARVHHIVNSTGDNIYNAKNCKACFEIHDIQNLRYVVRGFNVKDSMDLYGTDDEDLTYENINSGLYSSLIKFCADSHTSCIDTRFCSYVRSSSNLFACISLRNKKFCVFNKQYPENEYNKLVSKIVEHMDEMPYVDSKNRVFKYGEFFPPEISPFGYNETAAREYFPRLKHQILAEGFKWRESEEKKYAVTMSPERVPEIATVEKSVLEEVIGCEHENRCDHQCSYAFRLIPDELQFYQKMQLPIPHLCPNCRHYERLVHKNPITLWPRKCQCAAEKSENGIYKNAVTHSHGKDPCPNVFQTSYAPDCPEIVYCEQCYNAEVV
ncbi:MAG: hypothetical protein AAB649_01115 [Patescibacteria group bacterium]